MKTNVVKMNLKLADELVRMNKVGGIETEERFMNPEHWLNKGSSFAYMIDNRIAMVLGCYPAENEPKVMCCWMVPSLVFYKYVRTCHRMGWVFIAWIRREFGAKTLRTCVRADNMKNINFVEHLGFEPRKTGIVDDHAYIMYEEDRDVNSR